MKRTREEVDLRQWAELVLPWLLPADLAATSATCKVFRAVASAVTARRASDAARGLELHPIPFFNPAATDSTGDAAAAAANAQPYSYFIYSRFSVLPSSVPSSQPWGGGRHQSPSWEPSSVAAAFETTIAGSGAGCDCEVCSTREGGEADTCPCSGRDAGLGLGDVVMMRECGSDCSCGNECENRKTQRGISVRLKVVKDNMKGWGLHADQFIPRGQFVCEYAGELLTIREARKRLQLYDQLSADGTSPSALLVVREHLPSGKACLRINIDATKVGNIARFINHSCDGGNLLTVLVRNSGSLIPRLCFFAAVDIFEDQELTFSYGNVNLRQNGLPCFCGSSCCIGMLPSEDT